ncbi:hypothetical protein N9V96_02035 [Polaribacter sp.]|nr:hypothetical protein [Polaribacter sp.]
MKKEDIKNLVDKYEAGKTNLNEENFLFGHKNIENTNDDILFNFIKNNKKESPNNLNEKLWDNFEIQQKTKKKRNIAIFSAVASVALIVTLFLIKPFETEMSYAEKAKLLTEAKNMIAISEVGNANENTLYEDEFIIIYTTNK